MISLPLHDFHQEQRAHFGEVAGHERVEDYGAAEGEYRELTTAAGLLDFSFRGRICVLGNDRVKFVHGQVTNDVAKLKAGEGCYAGLVTAKGKLESDLFIFALKDELLLDFEPGLTQKITERLERYVIADDVQLVDVQEHYGLISVQGPAAGAVLSGSGLINDLPEQNLSWASVALEEGELYVMNNPRLGTGGFDIYAPAGALERVARSLAGPWCGWQAFETARIEAGIPRFGVDMDETNLAPETGIQDRAISYSKGCYIGQEVIARIRTYGKVAKALRLIRLADEAPNLPERGERLFRDGKEAGYLCSSTVSPKHGGKVALGYVRKEWNAPGERLQVGTAEGSVATVIA